MAANDQLPRPKAGAIPSGTDRVYRPQLDALRFFAFFAVFLFHTTRALKPGPALGALYDAGAYGMCTFFILSSYLITSLLVRERARFGTIHVRAFYIRRALRIWPLYFLFLGVNFVIGRFVPAVFIGTPRLLAFLFMMGNWYVASAGFGSSPIYPLWSISLEEQFYLVWPALVSTSRNFLLWASCALIPLSLGSIYVLGVWGASRDQVWVNSFAQFLFFACGSLLALYEGSKGIGTSTARGALLLAAGFGAWWATETCFHLKAKTPIASPLAFTAGYAAVGLACAAILFGVLSLPGWLVPRWLAYLGKISYGLYVFHKFCLDHASRTHNHFVNAVLSLAATIVCAAISYQFLEKPFLRLKNRFEFVHSRPV
jgi:peptidoglycan/LPS O-acetylase OafA/YrhL